jgi:3-hydroxyacyl-CoA dehydrogenase
MTVSNIRKVAVIGSGVMGSGIAAQVANAGVPVLLLDIVGKDEHDRSSIARGAVEKLLKTEPAPLMSPKNAGLIEVGNIDDDLAKLADCDWIVEVVLERLDVKQSLYRKIDAVRKPGTPVSSNTSTIPLASLVDGMPDAFAETFFITHFFNPPRYMRLLEIVTGPKTDKAVVASVSAFADIALGKSIVICNDSPGFIANRLGVYWMQMAVTEAVDGKLSIEEADAVMGRPFGVPKTGVFGLIDLVGLDLMPHINASLGGLLPKTDAFHATVRDMPLIQKMIADGYTGRKGKGGFYRIDKTGGKKEKQAIDLDSGHYGAAGKVEVSGLSGAEKNLRGLMSADSKIGRYAWRVMSRTLAYAAGLVPEAVGDITGIDEAMRLGYNWKQGPFELIDKIGAAWLVQKLEAEGVAIPALLKLVGDRTFYRVENGRRQYFGLDGAYHDIVRPDGVLLLEDIKLVSKPILKNGSAALWDIGDGVVCLEFTSKSNSMDEQIMDLLQKTIKLVKQDYKALVIYNEGSNFSVGANLGLALFAANIAAWGEIEKLIFAGQSTYQMLKYAPFPVVAAPAGMALGGGCEILLHSDSVQAHAELYAGLVECGVGLIPGWGGCKEMLTRWKSAPKMPQGPMPAPAKVFEMVSTATVSKSAAMAKDMLILRKGDGITMNRYRLLADSKAKALALAENYVPPEPPTISLPGAAGRVGMEMAVDGFRRRGIATPHDIVVAGNLAQILSGGAADPIDVLTEGDILALERDAFMKLIKTPGTLARIEHTLETGKPLRN